MARTTAAERRTRLRRLRAALLRHQTALAEAMYADFRKAPEEVRITELYPTLGEIDHALAKIDDGTYGICEVSGQPIPKERLKAIPWARERVEFKATGFIR